MTTKKIIDLLKAREVDYEKIESFSKQPGIYAIFFIGDDFPLLGNLVKKHQIIYIGKTESSQEKRDAKTHFTSDKTGSSTLRKSIGSLLCQSKNLKPVARNQNDYKNGRLSHFKFDPKSEDIITVWMKTNLALSFFEFSADKKEIEQLETEIISILVPILNISKNSKNPFKETLQKIRKNCALMAFEDYEKSNSDKNIFKPQKHQTMQSSGKYVELWQKQRESIKELLKKSDSIQSLQLNPEEFRKVGNRNSYSFNLEYVNGIVSNNVDGSAVARDLDTVLENSPEIMGVLKTGHHKINMDRRFCLWIQRKSEIR